MNPLLEFPVAASLAACILQFGSAWKALRKGRRAIGPADDGELPGISILKPLKGVDDRLLDNLESFCRLDYPRYEIVFCVQGASDPALRVARRVKETHPDREIVVVVGDRREGLNPKVNNMMPGYAAARYPGGSGRGSTWRRRTCRRRWCRRRRGRGSRGRAASTTFPSEGSWRRSNSLRDVLLHG